MEFNASTLVNPAILQLRPYQIGKPISEVQRELGLTRITKLASNENPLGTSHHVTRHLVKSFSQLFRYPDGNAYDLKQALSSHLNVLPEQLIIGNGSEEVISMLIQLFANQGEHILSPQYSFMAYKILAQSFGVGYVEVPAKHMSVDSMGLLKAIRPSTRMIIFANPNNPTGTYLNQQEWHSLMNNVPSNVIVVCDEAYWEYVCESDFPHSINYLNRYPNLVITRTFSKAYGLAGLRLGYGIAHPDIIELVNRVRHPFNVNHLAMVAGCLALEDQAFVKESVRINNQGKQQLYDGLEALGLRYIPTEGNFMIVHLPVRGSMVFDALLKRGVIVRPLDPYGLSYALRVSIGTMDENQHFLDAMKAVLPVEMEV